MEKEISRRLVLRMIAAAVPMSLAGCAGPGGGKAGGGAPGRLEIPDQPASAATKELWLAAQEGDIDAIRAALAAGADIEGIDFTQHRNGRRALNYAALNNQAEAIKVLLEAGANIQSQNRSRFTPLHHAAEAGAIDAIKVLLAHGADKRAKMYMGGTPQQIAEFKGHREAALLLVP